ncbi:hypothetical protein TBLA_0C02610 [Henningerozyma blattae CBS 6284]|uniref:54S ribosomal protein L27, mitochondrial n=1 Tax=Henningerozyma blattae (strain ATCC 34711 / CBS 6284 / DSM 70876 / NBRC 10599 / NRRL Y-10934 / UCD 77-7) TaxID=1071380 RepID=I2H118_HENB6|nr:hypothetical protein TBLA_0C02610 [Tetrapisispora blattae CBS 6284]CCH60070.1 hypothetical protein TBLA_0C02610 [Tetrapisispora blattae CBS 6284]
MKFTQQLLFHESAISQLTRPWKKYRDGSLFYGVSKQGTKRLPLTTKQGNKNMYKGTRSSGIGKHTKYGEYVINWSKVRTFTVPKIMNTSLKPLVSSDVPELKHQFKNYPKGPIDINLYFDKLREYVRDGEVPSPASDIKCRIERG